jgi:hypothetical protein
MISFFEPAFAAAVIRILVQVGPSPFHEKSHPLLSSHHLLFEQTENLLFPFPSLPLLILLYTSVVRVRILNIYDDGSHYYIAFSHRHYYVYIVPLHTSRE